MTRPDSDQSYDTESGLAAQNDISEVDLISFLDQGLEHQKTQLILTRIKDDPALRQQAVALQSTWDLLDLLPPEVPRTKAAEQAAQVIRAERRRNRLQGLGLKCVASGVGFACAWSAWRVGSTAIRPDRVAMAQSVLSLNLLDLLLVARDRAFLELLIEDPQAAVFSRLCRLNPSDEVVVFDQNTNIPTDLRSWVALEARHRQFLALPAPRQAELSGMSDLLKVLPQSEQFESLERLTGLRIMYDSISDEERLKFDQMAGQARWNRALRGAEQISRQKEGSRKQAFTVTEFNRPDYIMDLATLTASWMKMSPQEKNAFERRSRNAKTAPGAKTDRLRQLAQTLENAPEGTFPVVEALKNNPPPRVAAKFETLKQQREKKKSEYLETIRKAGSITTDPAALQSFLANLPPWLVDVIDPLPPNEARRLLGILKTLVDQNVSATARRNSQGE